MPQWKREHGNGPDGKHGASPVQEMSQYLFTDQVPWVSSKHYKHQAQPGNSEGATQGQTGGRERETSVSLSFVR